MRAAQRPKPSTAAGMTAIPASPAPRQLLTAEDAMKRGVKRMEMALNWHVGNLVGDDYDAVMAELMDEGV
jgi:transketolase